MVCVPDANSSSEAPGSGPQGAWGGVMVPAPVMARSKASEGLPSELHPEEEEEEQKEKEE